MKFRKIVFLTLPIICSFGIARAQTDSIPPKQSGIMAPFRDTADGAFDMSRFLIEYKGVMPVPFLITEPALGYGGGFALLYFKKQEKKYSRPVPPNITALAGIYTQNGTWAGGFGHFHVFGADKVRYFGVVAKPYININFYGNNNDYLDQNPVQFNLDALTTFHRMQVRLGESDFFAGASYIWMHTHNSIDTLPDKPIINNILNRLNSTSTLSILQPIINYDSRNNIFTPTKGFNTGLIFTYNAVWLGADDNFYRFNTYLLGYKPVAPKLYSAWRFDGAYMLGDAPLYALPFIMLRGVPAMRYQSNNTMLAETEWRYTVHNRWSVVAFTGGGKAFENVDSFTDAQWVYNYGAGFRYKLASAFGIHSGVDFASGSSGDFAFYIVFGSAWFK